MRPDILVAGIVLNKVQVIEFTLVHTAHGGAVYKGCTRQILLFQMGTGQRLAQGNHTHQRCTGDRCTGLYAHCTLHLLIGHLNLAHRELGV